MIDPSKLTKIVLGSGSMGCLVLANMPCSVRAASDYLINFKIIKVGRGLKECMRETAESVLDDELAHFVVVVVAVEREENNREKSPTLTFKLRFPANHNISFISYVIIFNLSLISYLSFRNGVHFEQQGNQVRNPLPQRARKPFRALICTDSRKWFRTGLSSHKGSQS